MSYLSGITGTFKISGNELPTTAWSVSPSAQILEFINSKTGLHPVYQSTILRCQFSVSYDWDPALVPFAAPFSLVPGQTVTSVSLYQDPGTAQALWSFASAIVEGTPQDMVRDGKITSRVMFRSSGPFVMPGNITV